MAQKTFYIGDRGPFYYDDEKEVPGGSEMQAAFRGGDAVFDNVEITHVKVTEKIIEGLFSGDLDVEELAQDLDMNEMIVDISF